MLLTILPFARLTEIVTRTSKSYSIVRRVRGKVSSVSSQDKNVTAGAGYVDSYTFRSRLIRLES